MSSCIFLEHSSTHLTIKVHDACACTYSRTAAFVPLTLIGSRRAGRPPCTHTRAHTCMSRRPFCVAQAPAASRPTLGSGEFPVGAGVRLLPVVCLDSLASPCLTAEPALGDVSSAAAHAPCRVLIHRRGAALPGRVHAAGRACAEAAGCGGGSGGTCWALRWAQRRAVRACPQ